MDVQQTMWDEVNEHLKRPGLYSPELTAALKGAMDKGLEQFLYQKRVMGDYDVIDYSMTFHLRAAAGWIGPDKYTASLRLTHPVEHHVTQGISTAALDHKLSGYPWDKEDVLSAIGGPVLKGLGEIAETATQLYNLLGSEDPVAKDIGERLAARYWLGTPMEKVVDLSAAASRFERKQEFALDHPESVIDITKAYYLLSGGSVATLSDELEPCWLYMDFSAKETDRLVYVEGLHLPGLLKGAPFQEIRKEKGCIELVSGLMEGRKMPVNLDSDQGSIPMQLHVDARQRQLVLSDMKGKILPLDMLRDESPSFWEREKIHHIPPVAAVPAESKRKGMNI